ncbi:MAG TPA: exosortase E/protease, VPEID-CTERM system [Bryobacteraceae bacterium]
MPPLVAAINSAPAETIGVRRLFNRLASFSALIVTELVGLSFLVNMYWPVRGPALVVAVHSSGRWIVQGLVAIVLFSLAFGDSQARGESRIRALFSSVSSQISPRAVAWPLFWAHIPPILLFAGTAWVLFERDHRLSPLAAGLLLVGWAVCGAAAISLAACSFLPPKAWIQLLRGAREAWLFGLLAAFAACLFGWSANAVWKPLSAWTLELVRWMLQPLVHTVIVEPAKRIIGTPRFLAEISPGCSGYEGIGLILGFTAVWLWFQRRQWRFPHALLLFPAGVLAIWVLNSVRIAALILVGSAGAPGIAMGGFHSQAGWICFIAVTLGMFVAARRVRWLSAPEPGSPIRQVESIAPPSRADTLAAPCLAPFLSILAAAMISSAVSADFEWLYPLRVLAAAAALWYFRGRLCELDWRFGWIGLAAGAVVFALWIGMEPLSGAAAAAMPAPLAQSVTPLRLSWIALRILGAVITVPIAEELAFRGYLFEVLGAYRSRSFPWIALLISSVAFGLLHGERWIVGTLAGMIFALAMLRRGRIGEAVAAHSIANALLAVWVLSSGNWALW